jgi:tRNA U34 5-methylaminomethyl-2-thiouridine-forming methyltransferase MnmC
MKLFLTGDGSKTIYSTRFGEHYHSTYGAVSESNHVYIEAGYLATTVCPVSVLEIGFGTGLNAWLTLHHACRLRRHTLYEGIELFSIDDSTVCQLSDNEIFRSLHFAPWEQPVEITSDFVLHKRKSDILQTAFLHKYDVVYFDAFSPAVQPEIWTADIFTRLYAAMNHGAIMTTYCAKGTVRRTMQSVGFDVKRLPGPAGKREILQIRKK